MATSVAKLARDTFVRAWFDIRTEGPIASADAASSAISDLLLQHPTLRAVPESSLRLFLTAAIQAVPEEIALQSTRPFGLAAGRLGRMFQGIVRPELADLRRRTYPLVYAWMSRDEDMFQASQLILGNWIAKHAGLDHHAEENNAAIWALGGVVAKSGVQVAEKIMIRHGGRIATAPIPKQQA